LICSAGLNIPEHLPTFDHANVSAPGNTNERNNTQNNTSLDSNGIAENKNNLNHANAQAGSKKPALINEIMPD
jgi:hypothetical protein